MGFWRLLADDEHPEAVALARQVLADRLADHPAPPPALRLPGNVPAEAWPDAALTWRAAELRALTPRLHDMLPVARDVALTGVVPGLVTDSAWLQYAAAPLVSHTPLASKLLRVLVRRRAAADTAIMALRARLGLPDPTAWDFAAHPHMTPPMLQGSLLALAAGLQPLRCLPELLGLTLHAACAMPDPVLEAAGAVPPVAAADAIAEALDALTLASLDSAGMARMQAAFAAAAGWQRVAREAALQAAEAAVHPAQRMAALLRRKAPYAQGYHAAARLGGRSLDAWFAEDDPAGMLAALAASPHVQPGDPDRSHLVAMAEDPRGAMVGIFDAEERATLRAWITALPQSCTIPSTTEDAAGLPCPIPATPMPSRDWAALPLRDLYHPLLHIEEHSDLLPFAQRFAALWLARAGAGQDRPGPRANPLARYDHGGFDAWLRRQHRLQVESYAAAGAITDPPTREAVIEDAVQLCPMVLIDGAWLQRMAQVSLAATPVGALLVRIWRDELGDGVVRENHPNVYRELMAEMRVALPPFGSPEFAAWPRFRDASFAVPVFWLAVSLFPRHFLPEILGLNLAMELSGVGGSYRVAADAMRRHGFTPSFVELHNTVDNVSTGHTAMAAAAIRLHLDEARGLGGAEAVQRHWKRIWTGYRALTPPSGFA